MHCARRANELSLPAIRIILSVAFLWMTSAAFSMDLEERNIEVVDYGIYTAKVASTEQREGVAAGKVHTLESPELVEQTDRVPAILGAEFGLRYRIKGVPDGSHEYLTERWVHPELKNPSVPKAFATSEYGADGVTGKVLYSSYKFEHPWELVPGKWIFQIYHDGRRLLDHSFTVYSP